MSSRLAGMVRCCTNVMIGLGLFAASLAAQRPSSPRPTTPGSATAAQEAASARAGRPVSGQEIAEAIKNSGLSPEQIRSRLRSAGYDPSIADAFLGDSIPGRTGAAASRQNTSAFAAALQALGIIGVNPGMAESTTVERDEASDSVSVVESRSANRAGTVFGKNIFRRGTTVFDPVAAGPVDGSYRLGVGDQLQLLITGAIEFAYQLDIRRDGTVVIPSVGQVSLAGLTLDGAKVLLRNRASRSYTNLADGSASLDLTLSRIRTNSVFVIGEVEQPGAYQVSALATAFSVVARAGGPTVGGSFRDVQIRRGGHVVAHMDLYDYLLNGDAGQDTRLEQGDVIFVPLKNRSVSVAGAVRRPGIFELRDAEGFADLLRFAGGLASTAATERVQIDRILPPEAREPGRERALVDVPLGKGAAQAASVPLFDGDNVRVFSIGALRRNSVSLKGEVIQPGTYELVTGMTLSRVLERAGGLLPWALSDRIKVTRPIAQTGRSGIISLDLASDDGRNFALQEFDEIAVLDGRLAFPAGRITVSGAVVKAGPQRYAEGQTLKDVLDQAAGFRPEAQYVEVLRRKNSTAFSDTTSEVSRFEIDPTARSVPQASRFRMQAEDYVVIRSAPGFRPQRFVQISGLFVYPGQYAIAEFRDRVSDAVKRAGGLLPNASPDNFRLMRNGRIVKIELAKAMEGDESNDPTLLAGDELYVGPNIQTVFVTGEVERPALVLYQKGMSFEDYVDQTGGAKTTADMDRAYIEAPNGDIIRINQGRFRGPPDVPPGATITIPRAPETAPTNWGERLTQTVQVISTVFSLVIAYVAVTR